MLQLYFFIIMVIHNGFCLELKFLGCYQEATGTDFNYVGIRNESECIDSCSTRFFTFALISLHEECNCGNYLGAFHDRNICNTSCPDCDIKSSLSDVYLTRHLVVGPPKDFVVENITDTKVHIKWKEPEKFAPIDSYKISAKVLHTYAGYKLMNPVWRFSNNTDQAEIVALHPSTKYNLSLEAIPIGGQGAVIWKVFETKIGEPDRTPLAPVEKLRNKTQAVLELQSVTNSNGPITSFLVIVIDANSVQRFDHHNLKSYRDAIQAGLSYYIAAEIPYNSFSSIFVVGNSRTYGNYYNAPLDQNSNYHYILAIKSESKRDNISYIVYSNHTDGHQDVLIKIMDVEENNSFALVVTLSIAIVILVILLLGFFVGFIVMRNRILYRNRVRLNDNQELTFQGPMINMENNAFIPEDEIIPRNHYKNLSEQVWIIPPDNLKMQQSFSVANGEFGIVYSGTVQQRNNLTPVSIYNIADASLQPLEKQKMLKDINLLIQAGKHWNIIELIGMCEEVGTISVVLEYTSTNLKELLLGSRKNSPGSVCNLPNTQLLDIVVNITRGMAHLESQGIVHKQLCARNVSIVNGFTPKISGFGIAQYYESNMNLIYTRWTAKEVFRGQQHISKSDVWSFACVLWEICALGGTPYGDIPNNEIPERILRNQHLKQLQCISHDIYQVMLNCWQFDMDERPTFSQLVDDLFQLKEDKYTMHLVFETYPGFQYEQYYPELELFYNQM